MGPDQIQDKLTHEITHLQDFFVLADSIIDYIQGKTQSIVEARTKGYSNYDLIKVNVGNRLRQLRPINRDLFIWDRSELSERYNQLEQTLFRLGESKGLTPPFQQVPPDFTAEKLDGVLYTMMQSVGCGLDLFTEPQFARKNIGTRFEDFVCRLLNTMGIAFKRGITVTVPVKGDGLTYRATADLVISPFETVKSSSNGFDPEEIIVSVKTSSKDRMKLIFTDRYLLTQASSKEAKVIALFLNDVQRMGQDRIASTFVADLFLVFCKFFGDLSGVYFIDPPRRASDTRWSCLVKRFDTWITKDLWKLLTLKR